MAGMDRSQKAVKQNVTKKAQNGKSKGKGKVKPTGVKFKVKGADGTLICYAFNNPGVLPR